MRAELHLLADLLEGEALQQQRQDLAGRPPGRSPDRSGLRSPAGLRGRWQTHREAQGGRTPTTDLPSMRTKSHPAIGETALGAPTNRPRSIEPGHNPGDVSACLRGRDRGRAGSAVSSAQGRWPARWLVGPSRGGRGPPTNRTEQYHGGAECLLNDRKHLVNDR
jgi:hypothetical protein